MIVTMHDWINKNRNILMSDVFIYIFSFYIVDLLYKFIDYLNIILTGLTTYDDFNFYYFML